MRIAHVVGGGYLPHESAGMQIHVRDLCRGLRARGHHVEILARLAGPEYAELAVSRDEWDGVPVTRLTYNFADVDRFELLYTHPAIDARFDEFLTAARPDLVNVHHLTGLSTSMIEVARRRGKAVVMALHDHWMVCLRGQRIRPDDLGVCERLDRGRCAECLHPLWPHLLPAPAGPRSLVDRLRGRPSALGALERWEAHTRRMLDHCHALTAPSRFHRDRFVDWGADPSRVFVVPHGLDAHTVAPARPRPDRPLRDVGYIGSVLPSKGVHVLVEALRHLARRDLTLHVHGEAPSFHGDTGYVERLRRLAGPDLDVRFHGRYEHGDLRAILEALDVVVVPSIWWESFSLTAREAALAGVPVVASRIGALEEAVDSGIALGFRPGDPADLARALTRVDTEPGLRAELRRSATAIRTLDDAVAAMEEVYRTALAAAAAAAATGG